jgi:drug/metabolite transporter (DMT)-like permease
MAVFGGELAAVAFGLASALTWGAGDFSGGLATKRAPVFGVLAAGQLCGLALLFSLALLWGEAPLSADAFGWGVAAGLCGMFGLWALYRALAVGQMGVVAPVSAVLTAAIPVLFSAATEGLPGALTLLGFSLALLGVWLLAGAGTSKGGRGGLGLALLAGCGFGAFFILIDRASTNAIFWPLVAARCGSLAVVLPIALARRQIGQLARRTLGLALLSGALDVAGNAFFVLATQSGRLDVAAILSSMYPASTVLLASALLGERVTRAQAIGIVAVLAAITLIAV